MTVPDATLWAMRHRIYHAFATTGGPPTLEQLATGLGIPLETAADALRTLGDLHSVYLTPDGRGVLMANPFSAVPTPYRVSAGGIDYWANCAWDMLGIPAALGRDAEVHAVWATDGTPAEMRVVDGHVESEPAIVHFQVPFRHWYADLPHT